MNTLFSVIRSRLTGYCLSYTLGAVSISIWCIVLNGISTDILASAFLVLALVLLAVQVIDSVCAALINKLAPFLIVDCVVITTTVTAFYTSIGWVNSSFRSITHCAIIIVAIFAIVYSYVIGKGRAESKEINRRLNEQNQMH